MDAARNRTVDAEARSSQHEQVKVSVRHAQGECVVGGRQAADRPGQISDGQCLLRQRVGQLAHAGGILQQQDAHGASRYQRANRHGEVLAKQKSNTGRFGTDWFGD